MGECVHSYHRGGFIRNQVREGGVHWNVVGEVFFTKTLSPRMVRTFLVAWLPILKQRVRHINVTACMLTK